MAQAMNFNQEYNGIKILLFFWMEFLVFGTNKVKFGSDGLEIRRTFDFCSLKISIEKLLFLLSSNIFCLFIYKKITEIKIL
jgi:hypothetical protein